MVFWGQLWKPVLFPTAEYAIFFLIVFAVGWSLRRPLRLHHAVLLTASYVFYGFWDWHAVPLLFSISLVSALVAQGLQRLTRPAARRALVALGVTLALATLALVKYLGFFAVGAVNLLTLLGVELTHLTLPEVMLPMGISFFTFHAISLMVDAYRGRIAVKVRVLDALLYVAFFPQLVAGPILRASQFLPQLTQPPDPNRIDASRAMELIVSGLIKKVLIASFLATHLVDPAFDAPHLHSGLEALLAVYGYAAQIFCDFSGYTDLAMGSALLLGYRFPENFRAPGLAESPRDFWHRWHLSLSTWLRDYLFIPLGGSRGRPTRTIVNLGITMVLGGLWHGAAWTFVVWGALHGGALIAHRLWSGSALGAVQKLRSARAWPFIARVLTFHFICFGWVFFRAPSLAVAGELLVAITSQWVVGAWLTPALAGVLGLGLLAQLTPPESLSPIRLRLARLPLPAQGLLMALIILCIEAAAPQGIAPFIYFRF